MSSARRPTPLDPVRRDPGAERLETRRERVKLREGAEVILVPEGDEDRPDTQARAMLVITIIITGRLEWTLMEFLIHLDLYHRHMHASHGSRSRSRCRSALTTYVHPPVLLKLAVHPHH